jgi:hypothetical protein
MGFFGTLGYMLGSTGEFSKDGMRLGLQNALKTGAIRFLWGILKEMIGDPLAESKDFAKVLLKDSTIVFGAGLAIGVAVAIKEGLHLGEITAYLWAIDADI